jgi:hypothetical protein
MQQQDPDEVVLPYIRELLKYPEGQAFVKYLFQRFPIRELPDPGLEESLMRDQLGFLRCGQEIWDIVSRANSEMAGRILTEVTEEQHHVRREQRERERKQFEHEQELSESERLYGSGGTIE